MSKDLKGLSWWLDLLIGVCVFTSFFLLLLLVGDFFLSKVVVDECVCCPVCSVESLDLTQGVIDLKRGIDSEYVSFKDLELKGEKR